MTTSLKFLMAAGLAFTLAQAPALAAGEGGGGGGTPTAPSPAKLKCSKGKVVVTIMRNGKRVKVCRKPKVGLLSDEEFYNQGRQLAKEGHYDWALQVLAMVSNQNDPKVLNYIGYSHRKSGRLETGISFYRKALTLNPDFVLAREYLGEGYVAAGMIDLAKGELAEIRQRCGETCEEYKDLAEAISASGN